MHTSSNGFPALQHKNVRWTPEQYVKYANDVAQKSSMDAPLRALAAQITAQCSNVSEQGAATIAEWIRANILYTLETPGREVLEGPYTTLSTGTADCDGLATLFATLCRSIGIEAFMVGVGPAGERFFYHAIGMARTSYGMQWFELSRDDRYGATPRPASMAGPPPGAKVYYWNPVTNDHVRALVPTMKAASYSMGANAPTRERVESGLQSATMIAESAGITDETPISDVLRQAQAVTTAYTTGATLAPLLSTALGASIGAGPAGAVAAAAVLVTMVSIKVGRGIACGTKWRNRRDDMWDSIKDMIREIEMNPNDDGQGRLAAMRVQESIAFLAQPTKTKRVAAGGGFKPSDKVKRSNVPDVGWADGSNSKYDGVEDIYSDWHPCDRYGRMAQWRSIDRVLRRGVAMSPTLRDKRLALVAVFDTALAQRGNWRRGFSSDVWPYPEPPPGEDRPEPTPQRKGGAGLIIPIAALLILPKLLGK